MCGGDPADARRWIDAAVSSRLANVARTVAGSRMRCYEQALSPAIGQTPDKGPGAEAPGPLGCTARGMGGYGLVQVRVGTVLVPFCVPLKPNWVVAFAPRFPL